MGRKLSVNYVVTMKISLKVSIGLLTPNNRKVTVSQTFEYNGASDVSLRVIKKHDYVYEDGEYKFIPPSVKESDVKTINVV